jgi:hypothetical protein
MPVDAIVGIQRADGQGAQAVFINDFYMGAHQPQNWHSVCGVGGVATGALLCHMADMASTLEASTDGLAPTLGLVQILASGVQQEVSTEGRHLLNGAGAHSFRRICEGGVTTVDQGVSSDFGQGGCGADSDPMLLGGDACQFSEATEGHQGFGGL